jgi:hypothetical protein
MDGKLARRDPAFMKSGFGVTKTLLKSDGTFIQVTFAPLTCEQKGFETAAAHMNIHFAPAPARPIISLLV